VPADPFLGITVARVLRPRGRRGEVAAEILTDFPERLTKLREVWLSDGRNAPRRIALRACWLSDSHGGQAIFHFEGCDSIDAAERLRGLEVQIPLAERMPVPPGHFYVTDLEGCEVWERRSGAGEALRLGVVRGVQLLGGSSALPMPGAESTPPASVRRAGRGEAPAGTPVLVVDTPHGELLIPFAEEICTRIDTAARRIEVTLPEGLRELNR
jgi:16S rRNA processing protein RimM